MTRVFIVLIVATVVSVVSVRVNNPDLLKLVGIHILNATNFQLVGVL